MDFEDIELDFDGIRKEIEETSMIAGIKSEYIKQHLKSYGLGGTQIFKDYDEQDLKKKGNESYRPHFLNYIAKNNLCKSVYHLTPGQEVHGICKKPDCKFSHDVHAFAENKVRDLQGDCHNYLTHGFCSSGVTCRFAHNHLEEDRYKPCDNKMQISDEDLPFSNFCRKNVKIELSNGSYDFEKSDKALQEIDIEINNWKNSLANETNGGIVEKRIGPASEEDLIKPRAVEKRKIDFKGKTYLAPMTGVGGIPFRKVCVNFGVDITCSEMVDAKHFVKPTMLDWTLVKRHESEKCFGVQLSGTDPEYFVKAAQLLEDTCNVDFIDINMDCPSKSLFRMGGGTQMMHRPIAIQRIVKGINRVTGYPVTLKMKTGHQKNNKFAHELISKIRNFDIDMITVHGRSKEQPFVETADWNYINECAQVADPIPVFGNGDVFNYEDYNKYLDEYNVKGVMIGRAALVKPWIFTEIKEQRHWDISAKERFEILQDFIKSCFEAYGTDYAAIERTRSCFLEWMIYFHRYIPIGLLERPQKIYQRAVPYNGRNDLESLMASPRLQDWIKLSTTLLGRPPNKYSYIPVSANWY